MYRLEVEGDRTERIFDLRGDLKKSYAICTLNILECNATLILSVCEANFYDFICTLLFIFSSCIVAMPKKFMPSIKKKYPLKIKNSPFKPFKISYSG